jgi:hypothetical protein
MKRPVLLLLVATVALVAWRYESPPDASDLIGTWCLDLRPTPEADPYFKTFVVTSVDGDSLQGTFYGASIEQGRVNTAWSRVEFAFVTSDGSGPYNHAARLEGDRLEGSTYALGRGFVLPWRAERVPDGAGDIACPG